MKPPEFEARFGIYTCTWGEPDHIIIVLDHLHASARNSELTAEVTVRSTLPGFVGHIHQARLNLSSTVARKTLAKHLTQRTPGRELDWEGMVESAAVRTLRAQRQGEPAIYLRDAKQPSDAGYLVKPLVIGRLPTMWFGDGGTGKSLLALALAISLHTGSNAFGMEPELTRRVAYLDWELDDWEHRERMRLLVGEPMPDLVYVRARGPIWDEVERLQRICAEHEIGYAIIDSVGMACSGLPIESSEAALRFYDAVRALQMGVLCIAHQTKDGGEKYPFGSVFWSNGARLIWNVQKVQTEGVDRLDVGLYNRKANLARLEEPVAFRLSFGPMRTAILRGTVHEGPLQEKESKTSRIRHALRAGPMRPSEIALAIDEDPKKAVHWISARLGEMVERGSVVKLPDGRFALPARPADEEPDEPPEGEQTTFI